MKEVASIFNQNSWFSISRFNGLPINDNVLHCIILTINRSVLLVYCTWSCPNYSILLGVVTKRKFNFQICSYFQSILLVSITSDIITCLVWTLFISSWYVFDFSHVLYYSSRTRKSGLLCVVEESTKVSFCFEFRQFERKYLNRCLIFQRTQ